jgi:hypothetical protein
MSTYLVKIGKNHVLLLSPKTSWKLLYFPKLKPSLSAPVRNIGALKASEKDCKKNVKSSTPAALLPYIFL